jgi:hypothetical protein
MANISGIHEMKARTTVFGVGGAGGDAVNNMITTGLQGVDFIVANTDAQALSMSKAERLIQMGTRVAVLSRPFAERLSISASWTRPEAMEIGRNQRFCLLLS